MNPDRDSVNFKRIIEKIPFNDRSMTSAEKQLVARKKIISEAEKYRPYFNFESNIKPK